MQHTPTHDAVIVGGSYAGLSAAMQLVRARRRVLVIDAGRPRNRFASHSHGVMAQDGLPGTQIAATAKAQVAAYPTAAFHDGLVTGARAVDGGFEIQLDDGSVASGRRLLLAHGVTDDLPDVPGIAPRWGRSVLHCPYCHGFEIGGGAIGVLGASSEISVHQALLIADWGDVTLFLYGAFEPDAEQTRMMARRHIRVEPVPVEALEGEAPALDGARLADGRLVPLKALFVGPRVRQPGQIAQMLGCALDNIPIGQVVRTDEWKQTTTPGVYAAGDARMAASISLASADGVFAGVCIHRSLVEEECA
ncbi:MAG TPA: NAD(P)/FAD-dependent oxidoreductase [Reyranella sp.]|nr:NAD(P)/FAD-dependent oxidoreductase [Reyranella sp.]